MLYELATFPVFLRFDEVCILYNYVNYRPIDKKFEFIESQLLPFKLALNDANIVEFVAIILQNYRNHFNDHSKLLDFIRNQFLPICNSSRGYKFQIWIYSDANSDTNVIASILEMDEIKHCSNVEIRNNLWKTKAIARRGDFKLARIIGWCDEK